MGRVRVLRILEYEGPREWVERTVKGSIHGTYVNNEKNKCIIRAVTLGEYPEIIDAQDGQGDDGRPLGYDKDHSV